MKILIGYFMRSGSTLLQHVLNGHSEIQSYSDLSSFWAAMYALAGRRPKSHICVKPMDVLYLQSTFDFYRYFDRFIWLARDPRDSYLSAVESGYAYWFWPPGKKQEGIDLGLLRRWRRVYRHYFDHPERWHLVRYEDLVSNTDETLKGILDYLELPSERLVPFSKFNRGHGGDFKIARHSDVCTKSTQRHEKEFTAAQRALFLERLGDEMAQLGYTADAGSPAGRAVETGSATRSPRPSGNAVPMRR